MKKIQPLSLYEKLRPNFIIFCFIAPTLYITILRPQWILNCLSLNFFFLAFALFLACSKLGKIRFIDEQELYLKSHSFKKWLFMIVLVEIFSSIFFINILQTSHYYLEHTEFAAEIVTPNAALILQHLLLDWGLFPWAMYSILACMLCFSYLNLKLPGLFSSLLPQFKSVYADKCWRLRTNMFIGTMTNIANTIALTIIILQIVLNSLHQLGMDDTNNIHVGAVFSYLLVAIFFLTPALDLYSNYISQYCKHAYGFILPFILLTVFFLIVSTYLGSFIYVLLQESMEQLKALKNQLHFVIGDWQIFYWAWWVVCAPLISSMIARLSKGRSLREVIVGVLALPTLLAYLLIISLFFPGSTAASFIQHLGSWLLFIGDSHLTGLILPLCLLGFYMTIKDTRYTLFGFMPYKKAYVTARPIKVKFFIKPLLQFTMLFIVGFLFANLRSIQVLACIVAIPGSLFFIAYSLVFYKTLFITALKNDIVT